MRVTTEALVSRAAFAAATVGAFKGRRRPGLRRRHIPEDTLLYAEAGALVVDTPTRATRLPMSGHWPVCVSVPATVLAKVCGKLKPGDSLQLIYAAERLILDGGAFILPARPVRPPAAEEGN